MSRAPVGERRRLDASAGAPAATPADDAQEWASRQKGRANTADLRKLLLARSLTLDEIASRLKVTRGIALDLCDALKREGANVQRFGDQWTISRTPAQIAQDDALHHIYSDARGQYRLGLISDTHFGSKYAREDVCDDLYDWFAREGVTRVLHGGNWIDGEARFNKYDLIDCAHGMQRQLDYFVERYPQRKGIETHYVAGDDHEGWYAQAGADIGPDMEKTARAAGRTDLRYLGYMESFITLEHKQTGETSKLLLMHPGGGSAYATSYAPQKVVESLQGGEKPGVICFGHWHKMEYAQIRGVHSIQMGCTKDLDPFGRKKRLSYHVGGVIVDLWQDPQGGISGCRPWFKQYFDRAYTNDQFNLARIPQRRAAPKSRTGR